MPTGNELIRLLNQHQYETAIPMIEEALRQAAAESPDRLTEVARTVVGWKGFFARSSEARDSVPYFRRMVSLLTELAGDGSPAAMAATENLAGILGSVDDIGEAIELREKVLAYARERFPADDPRYLAIRDGMAFLYRRAGQEDRAEQLLRHTGLCEHLRPAEQYLMKAGAKLASVSQPWSKNCHLWAWFEAVLDCERLIEILGLEACVEIHEHRGTHDGSERGLVCKIHHDGIMGYHPLEAGAQRPRIPSAG